MVAVLCRPEMTRETAATGQGPLSRQGQGWHGYPTGNRTEAVIDSSEAQRPVALSS